MLESIIYMHKWPCIRVHLREIELICVSKTYAISSSLLTRDALYTHLYVKTQLHAYPPEFATNSPVYLSHQRLCLSFTKIKCVSVRNSSISCPSASLTAIRQHVCDVSASREISALPPSTRHVAHD